MHALKGASRAVIELPIDELKPCSRNARTHSRKQLRQIANSIERFGFTNPVLIDDDGQIIAGHGRVEAAKLLSLKQVPTLSLSHLSPAERRAYSRQHRPGNSHRVNSTAASTGNGVR